MSEQPAIADNSELIRLGKLVAEVALSRSYSTEIRGVKIAPCDLMGRTEAEVGLETQLAEAKAELAELNDPYGEVNQRAQAWKVVAAHPIIGTLTSLPEANTYAQMVMARLDELAAERPEMKARIAALEAELNEVKVERDTWMKDALSHYGSVLLLQDQITGLTGPDYAAPSLPAVDSPEDLTPELMRLAADVIEQTGGYNAEILIAVIRHLEHTADRVEREQAEKAKRDKVIEDVARAIFDCENDRIQKAQGEVPSPTPLDYARALDARFDITPKAADE